MIEENLVITVTRLVKDDADGTSADLALLLRKDNLESIEAVIQELVGTALVELKLV